MYCGLVVVRKKTLVLLNVIATAVTLPVMRLMNSISSGAIRCAIRRKNLVNQIALFAVGVGCSMNPTEIGLCLARNQSPIDAATLYFLAMGMCLKSALIAAAMYSVQRSGRGNGVSHLIRFQTLRPS